MRLYNNEGHHLASLIFVPPVNAEVVCYLMLISISCLVLRS